MIATPQEVLARANPREYDLRTLEVGEDLPRYTEWLLEDFRPFLGGRVIEIGAGIGAIARRYVDDVDDALLVEPAPQLFNRLKESLHGRRRAHFANGTLEEVYGTTVDGIAVADGTFDTAVMVNVLEHIPDHANVLRLLFRLLKPGGALLVFVPAVPFLYGALDARVGHVRRYTRASLSEVVHGAGFTMKTLRYFDLLGMLPWLITGRLLRQSTVGSGSAKLYDQVIVPVCEAVDRAVRPRIGKNLVCVALKP